ncbi:peptidoglycan-binding domain-containing protein [Pelagibius marinus]|uniref:peptidoglycan-binding domain-containing protein n=1 Tax=Pelagibius marinus TaxID=2762760 RepID=UPI001872E20C|nr:peptidoglycan-binding domain-containing protein [Pelagibius marinus]
MSLSWRNHLTAALGAALFLAAGPAAALEPPALEELETLLRDLGFDPGKVDGVVDDDTIAAIRRYQDFALLPGDPEPSERLLNELRGVAAAFAALNAGKEEPPTAAPPPAVPDLGAGAPERGETESQPTPVAEKVVVPPPPPPPKLKPLEAAETEEAMEEKEQLAELPPAETQDLAPPAESVAPEAAVTPPPAEEPPAEAEIEAPLDPAAALAARIEAELAPHREELAAGRVTREALAQRFNDQGRQALQGSDYETAILKFSVAIHLLPDFAGAYSNRGTAYQRNEETDLAAADFAKAKQLGFGGFRLKDGKKPFQ